MRRLRIYTARLHDASVEGYTFSKYMAADLGEVDKRRRAEGIRLMISSHSIREDQTRRLHTRLKLKCVWWVVRRLRIYTAKLHDASVKETCLFRIRGN